MEPVEMVMEDLARQVAQKSFEAADARTRAAFAEAEVEQLKAKLAELEPEVEDSDEDSQPE